MGYISLSMLQNKGVVTSYLSTTDANYRRIIFGVIDYVIYLLTTELVKNFFHHIIKNTSLVVAVSIIITSLIVLLYTKAYGWWLSKHKVNKAGFKTLTVREQVFYNEYEGNIQADIFRISGDYVTSGIISNVNLQSDLSNDITLLALPEGYDPNQTMESANNESNISYFDMKNGLIYYLTYFSPS